MPYSQHPIFDNVPADETKIWRYLDFTKLVSMLDAKSLYFSSLNQIAAFDAFEGLYTRADRARRKELENWPSVSYQRKHKPCFRMIKPFGLY